jgi:anti-anti-sigma factor
MQFATRKVGKYRLISFRSDIDARSDMAELLLTIEKHIDNGESCFAVEFTANSYLYSKTIAVLVKCLNTVNEAGGRLAIVSPNPKLLEALRMFHLDTMLTVCSTVEELPEC